MHVTISFFAVIGETQFADLCTCRELGVFFLLAHQPDQASIFGEPLEIIGCRLDRQRPFRCVVCDTAVLALNPPDQVDVRSG